MKKDTAITIKYRNGSLPERLSDLLSKADETDLKIMVALFMNANQQGEVTNTDLAELLDIDKGDVTASLKFWRGAGLIENTTSKRKKSEGDMAKKPEADKKPEAPAAPAKKTAHRGGAIEQSGNFEAYSTVELAEIMEKRVVSPQFVDEAQRIMGKIFRSYDTGILVSIVDRLGFEEEAVLVILNYTVGKGKKTMRYAETVAMALYDEGITDTTAVIERIDRMERSGEVIAKIKTLYGVGDRALTSTEKNLFNKWTETYAYDIDVIKMAYDITVDNTQKPIPKYTNTIIERWYSEGLRTAEDVRRYLERQETDKGGLNVTKSYDTDDFFEAALQRSIEEIK